MDRPGESHERAEPVESGSGRAGEGPAVRAVARLLRPLEIAEDVLHYAVAVALLGVGVHRAVAICGGRVQRQRRSPQRDRAGGDQQPPVRRDRPGTPRHGDRAFKRGGFQLRPFLIIGIISAVRHILTVGAKSSLGKGIPNDEFTRVMVEYGVNVGIIVALVIALAIISRTNADQQATGTAMTATRSGPAPLPRSRVGGSRDDQLQDPPPAQRGEFQ